MIRASDIPAEVWYYAPALLVQLMRSLAFMFVMEPPVGDVHLGKMVIQVAQSINLEEPPTIPEWIELVKDATLQAMGFESLRTVIPSCEEDEPILQETTQWATTRLNPISDPC